MIPPVRLFGEIAAVMAGVILGALLAVVLLGFL